MVATGTPFTALSVAGAQAGWRPTSPVDACDFPLSPVEHAANSAMGRTNVATRVLPNDRSCIKVFSHLRKRLDVADATMTR
jgi:hypothetical protein